MMHQYLMFPSILDVQWHGSSGYSPENFKATEYNPFQKLALVERLSNWFAAGHRSDAFADINTTHHKICRAPPVDDRAASVKNCSLPERAEGCPNFREATEEQE